MGYEAKLITHNFLIQVLCKITRKLKKTLTKRKI